jgi:hypothetical protein
MKGMRLAVMILLAFLGVGAVVGGGSNDPVAV